MNRTSHRHHAALIAALASLSLLAAPGCKTTVNGGNGGNGSTTGGGFVIADGGGTTGDCGGSSGDGGSSNGDGCVRGGCSGQLCTEEDSGIGTTCEWKDAYACYHAFGTCGRGSDGECGWRPSKDLQACLAADGRLPASGQCVRNAGDACTSDDDCSAGGCGGEVCFNPALSDGVSTCDCTTPAKANCGCVNGQCAWWKELL